MMPTTSPLRLIRNPEACLLPQMSVVICMKPESKMPRLEEVDETAPYTTLPGEPIGLPTAITGCPMIVDDEDDPSSAALSCSLTESSA